MAGDWIMMRLNLHEDVAVISMAADLGLDEFAVVGRLHRLWAWADQQTEDGVVRNLSASFADTLVRTPGFCAAMNRVGWLEIIPEGGFKLVRFETWNGLNAKKRLKDSQRKSNSRKEKAVSAKCPRFVRDLSAKKTDKNGTKEEKRREEKSNTPTECSPPTPSAGEFDCPELDSGDDPGDFGPIPVPSPEQLQEVVDAWNAAGSVNPVKFLTELRRRQLLSRLRDKIFAEHWREAIQKISRSEFFANGWKPGFAWFLTEENFLKVLEGNYDHKARAGPSRKSGGDEGKYGNEWLDELTEADLKQAEL